MKLAREFNYDGKISSPLAVLAATQEVRTQGDRASLIWLLPTGLLLQRLPGAAAWR